MNKAFSVAILAAGLAGCAGGTPSPLDTRNQTDRPLPPGEGAFGNAFTWEWRKKDEPATAAPAAAAAPTSSTASKPSASSAAERQEFEEWRAWQEWKRQNPK